jgi:NTP pyrophosphatase (non-canonical NTP hydrolase)
MESRLKKNDHKGGWHDCFTPWLFRRLTEEVAELRREIYDKASWSENRIINEAADVANFAMMIADNMHELIKWKLDGEE